MTTTTTEATETTASYRLHGVTIIPQRWYNRAALVTLAARLGRTRAELADRGAHDDDCGGAYGANILDKVDPYGTARRRDQGDDERDG